MGRLRGSISARAPCRARSRATLVAAAVLLLPGSVAGQQVLVNTAASTYETFAGVDSVSSNPVETTLVLPQIAFEKQLTGPAEARIGEEVTYRFDVTNSAIDARATAVVVTDTLPLGLEYVSSQPPAQVDGRILSWTMGDVMPGEGAQILLTVRVESGVRDTIQVTNTSYLAADNAPTETAVASAVSLIGESDSGLAIEKSADQLEVALGETTPYTITLENTGLVPLTDLRIHDRLPEGGRYATGSLVGADSARARDRDLTIFLAGPILPAEQQAVRYAVAIVSAGSPDLQNTAYATALGETVRSNDASAWIRVRSEWPLETRAGIGKVWVDADEDGVQDHGEPGVAGVSIWTEDGEVSVTDREGRFSYRNLRPGRHGFRLDPVTLPAEYQLATSEATNGLVIRDADGWTTPRISFRVLPRGARVAAVRVPIRWSFLARPRCPFALAEEASRDRCSTLWWPEPAEREVGTTATVELVQPAVPDVVHFEFAKAELRSEARAALYRVVAELRRNPDAGLLIAGHADSVGPADYNIRLARARAEAVADRLVLSGIERSRLIVRSHGEAIPAAGNETDAGRTLNRRVELLFIGSGTLQGAQRREPGRTVPLAVPVVLAPEQPIEYQVEITNPWGTPLEGLILRFGTAVDSAAAVLGESRTSLAGRVPTTGAGLSGSVSLERSEVAVPPVPAMSTLRIAAWATTRADSASAVLVLADGESDRLTAEVHNPLRPVESVNGLHVALDTLPRPEALPARAEATVLLQPMGRAWPSEAVLTLPSGWEEVTSSSRLAGRPVPDPERLADRSGSPVLLWTLETESADTLELRLRPSAEAPTTEAVRVAALRDPEEREADLGQTFVSGPAVRIFAPTDGDVLHSDRHFIGVRGEPRMPVTLFDNDSQVAEAELRPDGVHDFIAIPLDAGPHTLKVRMANSWGQERWDSLAVHVTGLPVGFAPEAAPLRLTAGGHRTGGLRVRVLDRWGVPVVNRPFVTVAAEGAEPLNPDADASSVGVQVRPDSAGWMRLGFRAGAEPGRGRIVLSSGRAVGTVDLEILPAVRPLMIAGVGRVGIGASPDAFASLTARGRLDDRTSLTLSFDTRDLDAGRNAFGRISDPLEQAQYPILGDASDQRVVSSSRGVFSARLERGLDWVNLGDLATDDFGAGLQLTRYRRALTGAGAHVTTGPVTWKGFGSSTTQSLVQNQIRGAGISGPYELGSGIRPGTERIEIETRALENPERVLARQSLLRFVDYQIDYDRGVLLLKRPVPATDAYENPLFIVATYESDAGGDRNWVWGIRASTDVRSLLNVGSLDSLQIGTTLVRDGAQGVERSLLGADMTVRSGFLTLGGELSLSDSPDSSGLATALRGTVSLLEGDVELTGSWLRIGSEFHNPAEVALRPGSDEVRFAGKARVGPGELRLSHERQSFESGAIRRTRTGGGITQPLGDRLRIEARVASDRFESGGSRDASDAGELRMEWNPLSPLTLWGESRRQFRSAGDAYRPDHIGAGAALQIRSFATVEAAHRRVFLDGADDDYSLTSLGLRTQLGSTTEAWSGYEIGGAGGRHNAALVGLRTRLKLTEAWSADGMFERRQGIGNANVGDPVRALPFLQPEDDYWSFGLGTELLPRGAPYRLSARGELRDGDFRSTRVATLAGDVSVNSSLALLSRQEYVEAGQSGPGTASVFSSRLASLGGVAFRPTASETFNGLAKFELVDETNPATGGVLVGRGDEARLIVALEGIWSPTRNTEFGLRWAARRTEATLQYEDGLQQPLRSRADYVGLRSNVELTRWLATRAEGRLLFEHASGSSRWDLAPQLVVYPIDALELAAGYRFGDLEDPDFAVRGGHGAFLNVGVRLTEKSLTTAADFWRHRFTER